MYSTVEDRVGNLCDCPLTVHVSLYCFVTWYFFFQAEDGIRDLIRSRGLGDVYKRQIA